MHYAEQWTNGREIDVDNWTVYYYYCCYFGYRCRHSGRQTKTSLYISFSLMLQLASNVMYSSLPVYSLNTRLLISNIVFECMNICAICALCAFDGMINKCVLYIQMIIMPFNVFPLSPCHVGLILSFLPFSRSAFCVYIYFFLCLIIEHRSTRVDFITQKLGAINYTHRILSRCHLYVVYGILIENQQIIRTHKPCFVFVVYINSLVWCVLIAFFRIEIQPHRNFSENHYIAIINQRQNAKSIATYFVFDGFFSFLAFIYLLKHHWLRYWLKANFGEKFGLDFTLVRFGAQIGSMH